MKKFCVLFPLFVVAFSIPEFVPESEVPPACDLHL
jgi:hypothetical protein